MTTDDQTLPSELMTTALCRTGHPADAVSALLMAAGELLHTRFGATEAIALMRATIDDVEAAMAARPMAPAAA